MATDFPATGLDTFTDVATAGTILAATTNNMQDPIAAIEIKLGVNNSAVTSSIDYLLKSASSTDPGHLHSTSGISGQIAVAQGGTGAATAGAARTALGVVIGTDVQAYDADLTELAGLSDADGNFIVGSASGWVAESGATARTSIGLGSVENTALSTWAGTTNVTTLGTVGTGVWSGTAIADEKGGTGQTTYAAGDILYASGVDTLTKLAKGSDTEVLTLASGLPSWAAAGSSSAFTEAVTIDLSTGVGLTIDQSGAGLLMDLQVGGTSKFSVGSDGLIQNVTGVTVNSASPALTLNQDGAGDILNLTTAASANYGVWVDQYGTMKIRNNKANIFQVEHHSVGSIVFSVSQNDMNLSSGKINAYGIFKASGDAYFSAVHGQGCKFHSGTIDGAAETVIIDTDISNNGKGDLVIRDVNELELAHFHGPGQIALGTASLATTATVGFPYIPTCAGTPTGVPTAITGFSPIVYDTTGEKFWVYNGAWVGIVLA